MTNTSTKAAHDIETGTIKPMPTIGTAVQGIRDAGGRGTILDCGTVTSTECSSYGTQYIGVTFPGGTEAHYSENTRGEYWRTADTGEAWR